MQCDAKFCTVEGPVVVVIVSVVTILLIKFSFNLISSSSSAAAAAAGAALSLYLAFRTRTTRSRTFPGRLYRLDADAIRMSANSQMRCSFWCSDKRFFPPQAIGHISQNAIWSIDFVNNCFFCEQMKICW